MSARLPPMTELKRNVAVAGSFAIDRSQYRTCIMEEYNPECAPKPDAAASQARYYAAVERSTAARWRRGEH
jgi:hypothetical protein